MSEKRPGIQFFVEHVGVHIIGLLGWTPCEAQKFFQNNFGHDAPEIMQTCQGTSAHFHHPVHGNTIVVYMREWSEEIETIALLSHECIHACMSIFKEIGYEVRTDNDEQLTYLQQYIFSRLWRERRELGQQG